MKNQLLIIFLLFSWNEVNILSAQDKSIRIEDFSYKDGLTTSMVYSTYKDSKGFLWLCSVNGLFRYDGYSFRNINTLLKTNTNYEIYCIKEDADQNFLIGTLGKGILYYNTHEEKLIPLKLRSCSNSKIYQILIFRNKIWAASKNGLLVFSIPKNYMFNDSLDVQIYLPDLEYKNSQQNKINTLFLHSETQTIWIGSNGALFAFNPETKVFLLIKTSPQNSIRSLISYKDNILAGSWDGGIFVVNPYKKIPENDAFVNSINNIIGDQRIMTTALDKEQHLWVATTSAGIFVFNENKNGLITYSNFSNNDTQKESIKSDAINQLYIDKMDIVWVSMNQPALTKIYFQQNTLHYQTLSDKSNEEGYKEIITLNQSFDSSKIWVATNGQGLLLYDIKKQTYVNYNNKHASALQLAENDVSICYQDLWGNLWIVYRRKGLYILPAKEAMKLLSGNTKSPINPINANGMLGINNNNLYLTKIFQDSKGRIWIGSWRALYVISIGKEFSNATNKEDLANNSITTCVYISDKEEEINYPVSPVLTIFEKQKDVYWLGTLDAGIIELKENSPLKFSGASNLLNGKLPSNCVKVIVRDKLQRIWIATNSGLCTFDEKTNDAKVFTENDGLPSINIHNLIEDKRNNIWISTSYGIAEISTNNFSINNFFFDDEDKSNQYIPNAAIVSEKGVLCFALNKALVTVNPDSIRKELFNPRLYFTDIKIDNITVIPFEKFHGTTVIESNINESKTINVPYKHTLTLEFAALEFKIGKRCSYKYKIGDKNDWITLNSNQRSLILPTLRHGKYTLSIMLANTGDPVNIRTITLNYLPPFWQSKPAFLAYILFLLILFLTYRKLIIQKVIQKSLIDKERYERKKLEELDKMKTEFFTNISHEFRTPLSLIINPLEKLIKSGQLNDTLKAKIKLILKSSTQLLKLTNEMMDFSKIEKKLLKPDFKLCEIVSLIEDIFQVFYNMADVKSIDFNLIHQIRECEIPIDKGMIEKVIFNLLSNAFKYTPDNGVITVIVSKHRDKDNELIKISVMNTGEGIPSDNLQKIFDKYFQMDNSQNVDGIGIGLSLVKSYVELHNGRVEVKSNPHHETVFDIFLPVVQSQWDGTTSLSTDVETSYPKAYNYINMDLDGTPTYNYHILIIEDDAEVLDYLAGELSVDFKVATAKDGAEGLYIANETIPDLIVTDIIMPKLSGSELCAALKDQTSTSHIPIIVLSAKTDIEQQIEGLEKGADVYIMKPFKIEYLRTQVRSLLHLKENIHTRFLQENTLIPQGALNTKIDEIFFNKVLKYIEDNLSNSELNVIQLASHVSLSKVQLYRKLKAISGQSANEFIRTVRLKRAAQMMLKEEYSIFEIALETGFTNSSYFAKCFRNHFGKNPSEFVAAYANKTNR